MFKLSFIFSLIVIAVSQDKYNVECVNRIGGIQGCRTCVNYTHCDECLTQQGYKLKPIKQGSVCQCGVGYHFALGQCYPCSDADVGCEECTIYPPMKCTKCMGDIVMNTSIKFSPCSSVCEDKHSMFGCRECDGKNCTRCYTDRHYLQTPNEQGKCVCKKGYSHPIIIKINCYPCSHLTTGCLECDTQDYCFVCDTANKFVLNNKTNACDCIPYYHKKNNYTGTFRSAKCVPCTEKFCTKCQKSQSICSECEKGYTLNAEKKCVAPTSHHHHGFVQRVFVTPVQGSEPRNLNENDP